MAFVDYYKVMGINRDHPQDKMQEAYRKRVKQMHPDLHPNDPKAKAKFQKLQEAYEVLKDSKKRSLYNIYGENWQNASVYGNPEGGHTAGNPFADIFGGGGGMEFDTDFFQHIFGGSRSRGTGRTQWGHQESTVTEATIDIDVWTAMLGGEVIASAPTGKFKLKVAPGTQPGKKVKLMGKGGTTSQGVLKDLVITFRITIPTNLTEHQKDLLKQAKETR